MDIIDNKCYTGHLTDDLIDTLVRSVQGYINNHKKVKVGITNNYNTRASQHRRHSLNWDAMHVKYYTTSLDYVREIESIIINYKWERLENEIGGGGGNYGDGPYYLYVLIKKH